MHDQRRTLRDHYSVVEAELFGDQTEPAEIVSPEPPQTKKKVIRLNANKKTLKQVKERVGFKRKIMVIPKRYREFLQFHATWKSRHPDIDRAGNFFRLPKKKWFFNNFKESVIRERMVQLNNYLQQMIMFPQLQAEVYEFLGIDDGLAANLSPASGPYKNLTLNLKKLHSQPHVPITVKSRKESRMNLLALGKNKQKRKSKKLLRDALKGKLSYEDDDSDDSDIELLGGLPENRKPGASPNTDTIQSTDTLSSNTSNISGTSKMQKIFQAKKKRYLKTLGPWSQFSVIRYICEGDIESVKFALATGLELDYPLGACKWTPLEWAVHKKQEKIADFLIEHGASVDNPERVVLIPPLAKDMGIEPWDKIIPVEDGEETQGSSLLDTINPSQS